MNEYSVDFKLKILKMILNDHISKKSIMREYNVATKTQRQWIHKYHMLEGISGLLTKRKIRDKIPTNQEFESQVLSDEKLEEIYSAEIIKADEKKILEQEATSILSDYLVLYDEEFYVLDVPTEIYNDLSTELKNVVEASQYSIQLYNEGTLLLDEEGTLILAESAEEFVIQDSNIEFIGQYVMVWFVNVWVGYDIVAKPGVWSTILAVIFLVLGTASLIYDILTFDKDTYARIAYFYTGTMYTIMSQAVSTISKIPQYIVTGILTLMRFSSSVVSATISLVVTFLKMVFPPAVHASEMLSAISKGKSFIAHYNTILYSSYSII